MQAAGARQLVQSREPPSDGAPRSAGRGVGGRSRGLGPASGSASHPRNSRGLGASLHSWSPEISSKVSSLGTLTYSGDVSLCLHGGAPSRTFQPPAPAGTGLSASPLLEVSALLGRLAARPPARSGTPVLPLSERRGALGFAVRLPLSLMLCLAASSRPSVDVHISTKSPSFSRALPCVLTAPVAASWSRFADVPPPFPSLETALWVGAAAPPWPGGGGHRRRCPRPLPWARAVTLPSGGAEAPRPMQSRRAGYQTRAGEEPVLVASIPHENFSAGGELD